ncbi:MAG TPA: hypothetical protein VIF88_14245 [Methylocystis sp.]|jgi:hypothetical protein
MAGGPSITATVSAVDHASPELAKIAERIHKIADQLNRLGVQSGLAKAFNNPALDAHARALARIESNYHRLAVAAKQFASNVAVLASPAILHGAEQSLHLGAERTSEQFRLTLAGIRGAELEHAKELAAQLQRMTPILDQTKLLERYKEVRSILPSPEEAAHVMPMVARTEAAVLQSDPTGQAAHGLPWMLKAAEIAGFGQDIEKLSRYLDGAVRAVQIMGKTVSFEQLADVVKYSGAAAPLLSEQFLNKTAAGLAQELGGSTAGLGIRSFFKLLTSNLKGPTSHPALEEFRNLELITDKDIEFSGKGKALGLLPGHFIQGHEAAAHDPAQWVWTTLLPALKAKGFTDKEDQIIEAQRLFPNSNAARLAEVLINQEQTFKRHMALFDQAAGVDGALKTAAGDPISAAKSLSTAIGDFAGTLTAPNMEKAAQVMSGLASGVASLGGSLQQFQKEHPLGAQALGAVPVGIPGVAGLQLYRLGDGVLKALRGDFGLNVSAANLNVAAVALETAAARLGGGDLLGKAVGALGVGGTAAQGAGAAGAVGATARTAGLLSRLLTPQGIALTATTIVIGTVAKLMVEDARLFDRAQEEKRRGPRPSAYDESRQGEYDRAARERYLRALNVWSPREIDPARQGAFNRLFGTAEIIRASAFRGATDGARFALNSRLSGTGYSAGPLPSLPASQADRPKWPGIEPHGSTWAVPREISVQGTVQGEAHVSVENHVRVDASPQFLASIERRFADASARMQLVGKLGTTMQGGGNAPTRSGGAGAPHAAPLHSSFGFGPAGTR